jgi:hypothetical protein
MRMTVRANVDAYRAKVLAGVQARIAADKEAMVGLATVFIGEVVRNSPRDTNRFVSSFIQAGEKIGVRGFPKPGIKASSRYALYLAALVRQVESYDSWIGVWKGRARNWYEAKGRTGEPYYQKIQQTIRKLERQRRRALEELEKAKGSEAIIFMDEHGDIMRTNRSAKSRDVSTVRVRVYGGDGRIVVANGQVGAVLHSKEPHANFVEKRFAVIAKAKLTVRGAGLRGLPGPYAMQVRRAMRLTARAG